MDDDKSFKLSKKAKKKLENLQLIKKELSEGKTGQEVLGIAESEMEELYQGAYLLFEHGKYLDAADAFLFLVTMNPLKYPYWLGLGMSLQLNGEFEGAVSAYEMASMAKIHDPVPYFYLAKCLFALHERESTLQALELAIENCDDSEEYAELKNQAIKAKKLLERDFMTADPDLDIKDFF